MATIKAGMGQLLADIQVTAVSAGATIQTISGTTNTVGSSSTNMTANSVGSTQPTTRTVWDGLNLVVFPGVLAAGQTEPDLWMYVQVDNVTYKEHFYIDCSISGNMFPRRINTLGLSSLILGNSMLKAAYDAQRGAGFPKNSPLAFTGWKITKDISFFFYSATGFASTVFAEPPTVKLYGDVYDAETLAYLQGAMGSWRSNISLQSPRRALKGLPAYSNNHISGGLNLDSFKSLPGGANQGSVKVFRYFKVSLPLLATTGQAIYPLTSINQVGGKVGNVGTDNDLGYDYASGNNALQVVEYGRRPGSGAGYCGITFGGADVFPQETTYGLVSTYGNPRIPYGQVQPYLPDTNKWFKIPRWGDWSPGESGYELIAGETAAFFVSAQNGTTVSASTDKTAVGGAIVVSG